MLSVQADRPTEPPFDVVARFTTKASVDTQYGAPTAWCSPPRAYKEFKRYQREQWMVAHKTLPLGSLVLVIRHGNPMLVSGGIASDRGPYIRGRGIDVGAHLANQLRLWRVGVARVGVWVLRRGPGESPQQDYRLIEQARHWILSQ